jgi:hypothetical protein
MTEVFIYATSIIAAIGTILGMWFGFRQLRSGRKKLHVRYRYHPQRVLTPSLHGIFEVSLLGDVIQDPYVATIEIRNVGLQDIVIGDFTEGRPIEVSISNLVEIVSLGNTRSRKGLEPRRPQKGLVEFGPELIKQGESWKYHVITEGRPETPLPVVDHLNNVRVVNEVGRQQLYDSRGFVLFGRIMAPGTVLYCAIALILGSLNGLTRADYMAFGFFLAIVPSMVIFYLSTKLIASLKSRHE